MASQGETKPENLSRRTGTDRNGPERTETDFRGYRNGLSGYRNGLKCIPNLTGMDRNGSKRTSWIPKGLSGYRNGLKWIPKQTLWVQNRDSGCLK